MTKTLVRKHVLESRKIAFDIAAKDVGIAPLLEVISNLKKIKIIA